VSPKKDPDLEPILAHKGFATTTRGKEKRPRETRRKILEGRKPSSSCRTPLLSNKARNSITRFTKERLHAEAASSGQKKYEICPECLQRPQMDHTQANYFSKARETPRYHTKRRRLPQRLFLDSQTQNSRRQKKRSSARHGQFVIEIIARGTISAPLLERMWDRLPKPKNQSLRGGWFLGRFGVHTAGGARWTTST